MSDNIVRGFGSVGELSLPYTLTRDGDMVRVQFIDSSTRASFTFRIPARDVDYFVQRQGLSV